MLKPWELKADDARQADSLHTFIIFCEDEVSEYHYFKWFETALIKVNVVPKQKSMLTNINKALTYCTKNGLMSFDGDKHTLDIDGLEVWCVYDRDAEKEGKDLEEGNSEFNLSVSAAEKNDINLAWSNDAFELWVLLHLMEVDPDIEETKGRKYYYDQLTDYLRKHPNPNADLVKALAHQTFSYKKDMKHRDNFINIVRAEILPFTMLAIERAKKLHYRVIHEVNHYDKRPCTLVYLLVSSLLDKGKKPIPAA
ncbi:RloB family protein [uncultured Pedobacter sp.]|uniref:RloB family protein n=1 Tax=uncultured Pedobacter sp. TaxID=246139 RepID=UPI002636CF3C|nr:RloB family protein [uncultured Pedobacter sp.]